MNRSVTIQDIAKALNMSRNTVSKALNGKHVPTKTRTAVINAAIEMGYKGFKLAASSNIYAGNKKLMFLSGQSPAEINYYMSVLRGVEETLGNYDIAVTQKSITDKTSFTNLKGYLSSYRVDGIICIDFFESSYIAELVNLDIPVVFLDFPSIAKPFGGRYDVILPESMDTVKSFCMRLILEEGCTTFGFVGNYLYCKSFYERFIGMREALFLAGLPIDLSFSILDESSILDTERLTHELEKHNYLPDCFVVANDTIALSLLKALKKLKKHVPKDVRVIGFGNLAESMSSTPPLSTFNVNKAALGRMAGTVILQRMTSQYQPNRTIHISTDIVLRETT